MKATIFTIIAIIFVMAPGYGQKKRTGTLSAGDTANINLAARNVVLTQFRNLLISLSDPDLQAGDIDDFISQATEPSDNYIAGRQVLIDDDTNPVYKTHGSLSLPIGDYLKNLHNNYIPNNDRSVIFKLTEISNVKRGENGSYYLNIGYSEDLDGKCGIPGKENIPYKTRYRVAQVKVVKMVGQWKCYISGIRFFDPTKPISDSTDNVMIASGKDQKVVTAYQVKDDAYYFYIYRKGVADIKTENFIEAYRLMREAKDAPALKRDANDHLSAIKAKIRAKGDMDVNETLYKGMLDKAMAYEKERKYQEARSYYTYALECKSIGDVINSRLELVEAKIAEQTLLAQYFNSGLYDSAVSGYRRAIAADPDCYELWLGLAKCQWRLGESRDARKSFETAERIDPANPETHYWRGKFLMADNSEEAIKEIKIAINSNSEKVSEYSFDLGTVLYRKGGAANWGDALQFFTRSIDNNGPVQAYLTSGECYYRLNSPDKAKDSYDKYAGKLAAMNGTPGGRFYVDMGDAYVMLGAFDTAVSYYNKAMNRPEALFGKGVAYYMQNAADKSKYMEWFAKAYTANISQFVVNSNPFISKLNKVPEFKRLSRIGVLN